MKKIAIICAMLSALLLSGCSNPQLEEAKKKDAEFAAAVKAINLESADVGSEPKNYNVYVEEAIRSQLKDPDSAKFSGMTKPRKEVMVENRQFIYGYSTCVFVNAKNSYGGYVGKQLYWVFIRDGKVLRVKNTNDQFGNIIFVGRSIKCS